MTLDATWGGRNANAYDTLENVNQFIHTHVFDHADWESLTQEQKIAAILEATRDIDTVQFIGQRYTSDQGLEMPRAVDPGAVSNRVAISDEVNWSDTHRRMQRDIREATAFQALHIVRIGGRNFHAENQSQGVKSYSEAVGPIRESYTYGNAAAQRLSPEAAAKLSPWRQSKKVYRG